MKSRRRSEGIWMFVLALAVAAVSFPACQSTAGESIAPVADTLRAEPVVPDNLLYGIPVDHYEVSYGKVKRNEFLAEILYPLGFSDQDIYKITLLPDSVIDERKIKPGNKYAWFSPSDSLHGDASSYFVYEKDPLKYVVVGIYGDSIWARNGQKPIVHRMKHASGTIESSLWESMQNI